MELVDVGDSKSPGGDTVPVRVRPRALFLCFFHSMGHTIHSTLKKWQSEEYAFSWQFLAKCTGTVFVWRLSRYHSESDETGCLSGYLRNRWNHIRIIVHADGIVVVQNTGDLCRCFLWSIRTCDNVIIQSFYEDGMALFFLYRLFCSVYNWIEVLWKVYLHYGEKINSWR